MRVEINEYCPIPAPFEPADMDVKKCGAYVFNDAGVLLWSGGFETPEQARTEAEAFIQATS